MTDKEWEEYRHKLHVGINLINLVKQAETKEEIEIWLDGLERLEVEFSVSGLPLRPIKEMIRERMGDFAEITDKCLAFGVI